MNGWKLPESYRQVMLYWLVRFNLSYGGRGNLFNTRCLTVEFEWCYVSMKSTYYWTHISYRTNPKQQLSFELTHGWWAESIIAWLTDDDKDPAVFFFFLRFTLIQNITFTSISFYGKFCDIKNTHFTFLKALTLCYVQNMKV